MMVTSCNKSRIETVKGYWSGWDQEWVSERNRLYNCISLEGTCLEWTKFFSLFPVWSWKAHNLHNVLGLIHLGLDSLKMLSTSSTRSYFSTCLKLAGIIHALKAKHMLCWKLPWMCCRAKASDPPEDCVRGLPVFGPLTLQNWCPLLLGLIFQELFHDTAGIQRGESTTCFSLPTQENPLLVQQCADV